MNKKYDDWEILDALHWDLEYKIPENDYALDKKFPPNYLCGIQAKHRGEYYISRMYKKPTVTLIITSWLGLSFGAIHYYGTLEISIPDMTKEKEPSWSCSCWGIPAFNNDKITLTAILEQWEIDKYPHNYKYKRVGNRHRGFYGKDSIEARAKEIFNKFFGEGWEFKIDNN